MSLHRHAVFAARFEAVLHDRVHDGLGNAESLMICPKDLYVFYEAFGVDRCLYDHDPFTPRETCGTGPCDGRFFYDHRW